MGAVIHLSAEELEAGLAEIRRSPRTEGRLAMLVRRPRTEEREILERGVLDIELGLVGDNWQARGSSSTEDGTAHPEMQLNLMNARAIDLITGDKSRWHLAGDQLFIDMDLSGENLPPGTRLIIGSATLEVTDQPHGVSEVRGAVRRRCDEVRQFADRPSAEPARYQCARRAPGRGAHRRRGHQSAGARRASR